MAHLVEDVDKLRSLKYRYKCRGGLIGLQVPGHLCLTAQACEGCFLWNNCLEISNGNICKGKSKFINNIKVIVLKIYISIYNVKVLDLE